MNSAGVADFDFLMGCWNVAHRRLKVRLADCDDWEVFRGTSQAQKTLGGLGNIDDNVLDIASGTYRALTIRAFDRETNTWSIWWLDGRQPGRLDVPVVGRFEAGIGTFFAHDTWEGKPLLVRFLWTQVHTESPRWEQAFSLDGGATWETNWVMDFARRA